jgi:N-acyl-D-aspartate/D-glutamate deacylase
MTSLPAQKLKLGDRGLIKENMWADIVLFNADTISDKATFSQPHRYPNGIEHVIVNGEIVIDHGQHRVEFPGQILRLKRAR